MSDVKAFLVGIPTCGVGTVVSYVKDVIDMAMGIIKQLKSDGDVTINVLNARRAKIKGLIVEMKKGIENYKKELLENLKSKIKEDEDNEQKEVKESAMIRLAIYESCHAGEITEEERDTLLALV